VGRPLALYLAFVLLAACGGGGAPTTSSASAPPPSAVVAPAAIPPPAAAGAAAAPEAPAEPTVVRIAMQASGIADAGIYLADARGYFRAQGIQIERQAMQSGAQALPVLATSQIDIAAFAPNAAMMNALGRGITVKIVADKGREGPGFAYQSVMVRKDLIDGGAFHTARDLRGRRVAMPATGNPLEASLAAGLAQAGLTTADVQIELMGFPDMLPALTNASVDVGLLIEPLATELLRRGGAVAWLPLWEFYPDQQVAVIMYGPSLTDGSPDLAHRWMVAYVQALRFFNDAFVKGDPAARAEAVQVLAANTRLAPELIEEIAGGGRLAGLHPDGRVNATALRDASAYWRRTGTQTVDLSIDQLIDDQYVDRALQVLEPYR
jgi:NitT/TauT family transport system substrate-binding protein